MGNIDSDLLPFNFAGQNELSRKAGISSFPAAAHFYNEKGSECLQYIAVSHATGPKPTDTEPGHPTFVMIQEAINTYRPNIIIAEGFTNEQHFLEHIGSICDREPGESMYTVQLAKANNIPFTGGEPTDILILKGLQQQNYTAEDMVAFYITQQLPQLWRNQNPILQSRNDLKVAVEKIISWYTGTLISDFTYDKWQDWYKQHYGQMLPFEELIDDQLTAPCADGTILQKLAHETGLIRDREVLVRILEAKNKGFARILVVYGGSHYYTQHKTLERYFGIPTYTAFPSKQGCCLPNCALF